MSLAFPSRRARWPRRSPSAVRAFFGPGSRAGPPASGFSVAIFRRRGRLPALLSGALLPFDLLPRTPGMLLMRATSVEIESGAPAQADGDPAGLASLRITDAPSPIAVISG
jgi:hypothetical protein